MARIDFNNITFTGKDLITYGSILFAISGLYYKSIITDVEKDKKNENERFVITQKLESVTSRVESLEKSETYLKDQVRVLQDNELKRSTLESSNGYLPLKKK